jgi:hypothetical protein
MHHTHLDTFGQEDTTYQKGSFRLFSARTTKDGECLLRVDDREGAKHDHFIKWDQVFICQRF